jgi:hypothetical protein
MRTDGLLCIIKSTTRHRLREISFHWRAISAFQRNRLCCSLRYIRIVDGKIDLFDGNATQRQKQQDWVAERVGSYPM